MIGTEWSSIDGVRRVIGSMQIGERHLWEVQTGNSRICDLHDDADLERVQMRDAANLASRNAVTSVTEQPKPATSLEQFLATMPAMEAGRARKSLERYTRLNGKNAATRAQHIETLVTDGWRVSDDNRLRHPQRDTFFTSDAWTSFGMRYASWLTPATTHTM